MTPLSQIDPGFLESIQWNEDPLRDRCQQLVAQEHSHPEAIGVVDESGVAQSGRDTVGVEPKASPRGLVLRVLT